MISDYKKSSIDRRDERATKSPEEDAKKPANKRKNKKRFCRGKEGVEHKPECFKYQEAKKQFAFGKDWRILVCTECGRDLDHYYPLSMFGAGPLNKPPPSWVDK